MMMPSCADILLTMRRVEILLLLIEIEAFSRVGWQLVTRAPFSGLFPKCAHVTDYVITM